MNMKKWFEKKDLKISTSAIPQNSPKSATDSAFGDDLIKLDFIKQLPAELSSFILSYLEPFEAMKVSRVWYDIIKTDSLVWKHQFMRKWGQFPPKQDLLSYQEIYQKRCRLKQNWLEGSVVAQYLEGHEDAVYCLQFSKNFMITGSRDRTIKVWDLSTCFCKETLYGHDGSVLCLLYNDNYIISGSSDATIRIWDINTFELLRVLRGHVQAVLDVQFYGSKLVSSSKDHSIKIWDMDTGDCINTLNGHLAAVNSIKICGNELVSAAGDADIRYLIFLIVGIVTITIGYGI